MSEADVTPEADREGDAAHPRRVYDLIGHDTAEAQIAAALTSGRMHHAWMITGPKGVGKATLAYRLARRALGAATAGDRPLSAAPDDPICRQVEALSHPDFLLIRRPYDDKRGKLRGEITVDEARRAPAFFSKRASGAHRRVAIVDAADDMNVNAANALLKTLEEPPKDGILILIVHAPGRLLDTIRSRCRRLALRPPPVEACAAWLKDTHGVDADTADGAAALAGGAPGRALSLAERDAGALKAKLDTLLSALPRLDRDAAAALADQAGAKEGEAFLSVLMDFLVDHAREQARTASQGDLDQASRWAETADSLGKLGREQETLYLDPRQTAHAAFAALKDAAAPR